MLAVSPHGKRRTDSEGGFYIQLWTSADRGVHWQEASKLSCQTFGQDMSHGFESYGEPFFLKAANGDLLMFLRTGLDHRPVPKQARNVRP